MNASVRLLTYDLDRFPFDRAAEILKPAPMSNTARIRYLAALIVGVSNFFGPHPAPKVSPYGGQRGQRTLSLTDRGIEVTSRTARWFCKWPTITEVIAGPEGSALVLLGLHGYVPVSADAFDDASDRDGFISVAKRYLSSAKDKAE